MTAQDYVTRVIGEPTSALIPLAIVGEALGLSRSAVIERLKSGALDGGKITVGETVYRGVTVASLERYMAQPQAGILSDDDAIAIITTAIETAVQNADSDAFDDLTLAYSEVMEAVGLAWRNPQHRGRIGYLLGEISRHSLPAHGFLLSAAVVRKTNRRPNDAFFGLARDLKILKGNMDEETFWCAQMAAIRTHYR